MDSFEISGRGAIKKFIELAHSGPYDMLLDVAAAWDEMAHEFDNGGPKYTLQDFIDAGHWAVQDVEVTLDMVLEVAGMIEALQRSRDKTRELLQALGWEYGEASNAGQD